MFVTAHWAKVSWGTLGCRSVLVPISKVTLSVAVQQNKELERQQAAIQQVTLSLLHPFVSFLKPCCLYAGLSVCLPFCIPACLSVCLCLGLPVCLSVSVCVCLSVCSACKNHASHIHALSSRMAANRPPCKATAAFLCS